MSVGLRKFTLSRRQVGVANFSADDPVEIGLTLAEVEKDGVLHLNCGHKIGIATATEVGLSADRYPILVNFDDARFKGQGTELVCGYWKIVSVDAKAIPFSRKAAIQEKIITAMYTAVPQLDTLLWNSVKSLRGKSITSSMDEALQKSVNDIYMLASVENPTALQMTSLSRGIQGLIDACVGSNRRPRFIVGDGLFLYAIPHGVDFTSAFPAHSNRNAIYLAYTNAILNFEKLSNKYETVPVGTRAVAAHASMMAWRCGLYETFEKKEFIQVFVKVSEGSRQTVEITEVIKPEGVKSSIDLTIGRKIDISKWRMRKEMPELGTLLCTLAGMQHYMLNHTTGGSHLTGPLLTTLAMYGYVTANSSNEEVEAITSMMYETLHPINKRAIANLFFKNSGVLTHGRSQSAPQYDEFQMDSFTQIRCTPYPAGTHKAYLCAVMLEKVLASGLDVFLPWSASITECINTCKDVIVNGARSHIGSAYYTGDPPKSMGSSLDAFMPDLACYLHTFNRGDSLCMSPHLNDEVARRASMQWANLLRDLKAKDVSATSIDKVREYLTTTGAVHYTFDPADEGTWAGARETSRKAIKAVKGLFAG